MQVKLDVLLIQIVNILILLWVFKKIIGDSLTKEIIARKKLMKKLENTDAEYQRVMAEAAKKAEEEINQGMKKKQEIIAEGTLFAEQKKQAIIEDAYKDAEVIKMNAKDETKKLETELKDNREKGVKKTTEIVVKKLLNKDVSLKEEYINAIMKDIAAK